MTKHVAVLAVIVLATGVLSSGCARVMTPAMGVIYSSTDAPIAATTATGHSKVGTASCSSVLGIVATGDASITAAMRNGGITKIHHVDYHSTQVLGLYAKMTTTVYGE